MTTNYAHFLCFLTRQKSNSVGYYVFLDGNLPFLTITLHK